MASKPSNSGPVPQGKTFAMPQAEQLRPKLIWDEQMGLAPEPVIYDKTSVLTLSWGADFDDLGVGTEVTKLGEVFKDLYRFKVVSETLHNTTHPQTQAFKHLSNFVAEEDSARSLLIVYYAGHGYSGAQESGNISLSFSLAGTSPSDDTQKQDYTIEWVDVERVLAKTKSDVFVIFDCCHAGLLCRPANRGSDRCFQYMGACSPYQRTKRAGRASFTTAMIWALERLSSKPGFPSSELLMTITEAPNFPRDQYPELYGGRFEPSAEYIYIAPTPLPNESIQVPLGRYRNVPAEEEKKQQEYLDLRFHFDSPISREALVRTADTLKRQMKIKKLECRRVTFRGKYSAAEWAASAFLDRIRHKRNVTANQPTPTAPTFMLQGPLTSDETAPPALRLDTIPRTPSPSGPSSGVLSPWIRSEEHGGRPEQKSAGRELERRSSTDAETARGNSIDDHSAQKRKHTTEGEKDMAEDDNQPKGSKRQKSDGRVAGEDGLRESSELRRRSTRRSRGKASTSA